MVLSAANLTGKIAVPPRGRQVDVTCHSGTMRVTTSAPLCVTLQYDLGPNQKAEIIIVPDLDIEYTAGPQGAQFDIATVV